LAGFGVQNPQETARVGVTSQFLKFLGGKRAGLVADGEFVHAGLVLVAESELKQLTSQGR
jgi:hypothetical protein